MTYRLPKKRTRPKMGVKQSSVIRCPGHLAWVRGRECCIAEKHTCVGRIEAHHVVTTGAGGGDEQVVSLCTEAHAEVHRTGRETFAKKYAVDLPEIAARLWQYSPHRISYLRKLQAQNTGEK